MRAFLQFINNYEIAIIIDNVMLQEGFSWILALEPDGDSKSLTFNNLNTLFKFYFEEKK
jgi:hypothetical protein